jgi:hypothetical protein
VADNKKKLWMLEIEVEKVIKILMDYRKIPLSLFYRNIKWIN